MGRAGFSGCFEGAVCTGHKYENLVVGIDANIFERDGQVSYQTPKAVTEWHGSFTRDGSRIIIKFHCQGNEQRLKTTMVDAIAPDRWEGLDYAGRAVILTRLGSWTLSAGERHYD